ncbi:unnamed protein product [Lasius platythorax]|uniref:Secreted protein n=1 Tax=Lasius platythorax TaxID=488582 RepID=A0AAV2NPL6_9HYME
MTLFITSVLALRYKAGVSLSAGRSTLSDSCLVDTTGDVVPVGQKSDPDKSVPFACAPSRRGTAGPGGNNSQSEYTNVYT